MNYHSLFPDNPVITDDMKAIFDSRKTWEPLYHSSVLVTGAGGMIASYIVFFLIYLNEYKNAGITIHAGIRKKEKAAARFGSYVEKDYFRLFSRDATEPIPSDISADFIFHAASFASPQYYGKSPVETMAPNLIGTWQLLEHARRNPVKSMVFFSSGSIYGQLPEGTVDVGESDLGIMDFLNAGNCYGESKRAGEALCKAYCTEYDIPVKSCRIHHTYGPTMDPFHDTRVFAEFTGNILKNQNIIMKSSGTNKRSFCYITDTVAGILTVLLDGTGGESYNIANPSAYLSVRELAELLVGLFPEKNLSVLQQERKDEGYASNPARRTNVSVKKLEALGWKAHIPPEEGFLKTIQALEGQQ